MSPARFDPDLLVFTVPLAIRELARQGGPSTLDRERARVSAHVLAAAGDVLLYGDPEQPALGGQPRAERLRARLVHALAVLAFQPGGVTAFGWHFSGPAGTATPAQRTGTRAEVAQ